LSGKPRLLVAEEDQPGGGHSREISRGLSLMRERGSRHLKVRSGSFEKVPKRFDAEKSQRFKAPFGNTVGGIGETRLAGIIGKNQGLESEKGQRSRDGPDIVGVANAVQNKMNGSQIL
jgi:hypothetical protein